MSVWFLIREGQLDFVFQYSLHLFWTNWNTKESTESRKVTFSWNVNQLVVNSIIQLFQQQQIKGMKTVKRKTKKKHTVTNVLTIDFLWSMSFSLISPFTFMYLLTKQHHTTLLLLFLFIFIVFKLDRTRRHHLCDDFFSFIFCDVSVLKWKFYFVVAKEKKLSNVKQY